MVTMRTFSLNYDIPFIKGLSVRGTYAVGYDNSYNNVGDYYQLARAGNTDREGMHLIGERNGILSTMGILTVPISVGNLQLLILRI